MRHPSDVGLDDSGEVLREESVGMTFVREPQAQAMSDSGAFADIITETSVPFNLKLPPTVSYMKVRLRGIELANYDLKGGGQTLSGDTLDASVTISPAVARWA